MLKQEPVNPLIYTAEHLVYFGQIIYFSTYFNKATLEIYWLSTKICVAVSTMQITWTWFKQTLMKAVSHQENLGNLRGLMVNQHFQAIAKNLYVGCCGFLFNFLGPSRFHASISSRKASSCIQLSLEQSRWPFGKIRKLRFFLHTRNAQIRNSC